jgi:hypothetical protein
MAGYIVETATGKGRTNHKNKPINGKIQVEELDSNLKPTGRKLLCDPSKIKPIGMWD